MLSADLLSWAIYIDLSLTSEEFNIHDARIYAYSLALQPQMVTLNVSACSSEMPTCRVQWTSRMVLASKYMRQNPPNFHVLLMSVEIRYIHICDSQDSSDAVSAGRTHRLRLLSY